jgi:hypothetical protein
VTLADKVIDKVDFAVAHFWSLMALFQNPSLSALRSPSGFADIGNLPMHDRAAPRQPAFQEIP